MVKNEFSDPTERRLARLARRFKSGEFSLRTFKKKAEEILSNTDPTSRPIYEERLEVELGKRAKKVKAGA